MTGAPKPAIGASAVSRQQDRADRKTGKGRERVDLGQQQVSLFIAANTFVVGDGALQSGEACKHVRAQARRTEQVFNARSRCAVDEHEVVAGVAPAGAQASECSRRLAGPSLAGDENAALRSANRR